MKERVVATNAEQMPKINYNDQRELLLCFSVQLSFAAQKSAKKRKENGKCHYSNNNEKK